MKIKKKRQTHTPSLTYEVRQQFPPLGDRHRTVASENQIPMTYKREKSAIGLLRTGINLTQ